MTMAEPSRCSMLENGAGHDIAQTGLTGDGQRESTERYSLREQPSASVERGSSRATRCSRASVRAIRF